jgi:hypothetical protein
MAVGAGGCLVQAPSFYSVGQKRILRVLEAICLDVNFTFAKAVQLDEALNLTHTPCAPPS